MKSNVCGALAIIILVFGASFILFAFTFGTIPVLFSSVGDIIVAGSILIASALIAGVQLSDK